MIDSYFKFDFLVNEHSGEVLQLAQVSRQVIIGVRIDNIKYISDVFKDIGAFMCIAKNDVPPTVSKRIMLHVNCKKKAQYH